MVVLTLGYFFQAISYTYFTKSFIGQEGTLKKYYKI